MKKLNAPKKKALYKQEVAKTKFLLNQLQKELTFNNIRYLDKKTAKSKITDIVNTLLNLYKQI